jgi:hypothetical protein
MLLIYRGQTNNIYVTLTEKMVNSEANYVLMECFNKETNIKSYAALGLMSAANLSLYPERYDLFEVIENDNPLPITNEITLQPGDYVYKFYETTGLVNEPANEDNVLEEGSLTVIGTASVNTEYTTSTTNTVYNG